MTEFFVADLQLNTMHNYLYLVSIQFKLEKNICPFNCNPDAGLEGSSTVHKKKKSSRNSLYAFYRDYRQFRKFPV